MFQRTESESAGDARLMYMLDNVSRWLQFAEAKNGVALTASGGALFAIIGIILPSPTTSQWKLPLTVLAIGLVVVIVLSLLSFLPQISIKKKVNERGGQQEKTPTNLLFYGHIHLFSFSGYKEKVQKLLRLETPLNDWQSDLVEQIWINSRIAYCKYAFFNGSLMAILIIVIVAVCCFMRWY